jgi:hypothetical protein
LLPYPNSLLGLFQGLFPSSQIAEPCGQIVL